MVKDIILGALAHGLQKRLPNMLVKFYSTDMEMGSGYPKILVYRKGLSKNQPVSALLQIIVAPTPFTTINVVRVIYLKMPFPSDERPLEDPELLDKLVEGINGAKKRWETLENNWRSHG